MNKKKEERSLSKREQEPFCDAPLGQREKRKKRGKKKKGFSVFSSLIFKLRFFFFFFFFFFFQLNFGLEPCGVTGGRVCAGGIKKEKGTYRPMSREEEKEGRFQVFFFFFFVS